MSRTFVSNWGSLDSFACGGNSPNPSRRPAHGRVHQTGAATGKTRGRNKVRRAHQLSLRSWCYERRSNGIRETVASISTTAPNAVSPVVLSLGIRGTEHHIGELVVIAVVDVSAFREPSIHMHRRLHVQRAHHTSVSVFREPSIHMHRARVDCSNRSPGLVIQGTEHPYAQLTNQPKRNQSPGW